MIIRLFILALFTAASQLSSAPLRVVTFNIETNRDSNGGVTESLNDPGTTDFNSVRDVLLRIDADVICLQELANADISGGTNGGTSSDVHSLASELGLSYVHIPTNSGVFDFTLRNAIISRYPINTVQDIGTGTYMTSISSTGTGGGTAKDVTRAMPAFTVDVPGAAAPATIVTLHNKAQSSPVTDDKFRQAIELARAKQYLDLNGLDATDNIIVLGDFNLGGSELDFTSEPTTLPGTWNRGSEIPLSVNDPIAYRTDPEFYFSATQNLSAIDARDLDNNDETTVAGSKLDFILTSPAIIVSGSEIYRSSLDTSNNTGLPKNGAALDDTSSTLASDHYAIFADLELEDAIINYSLTDSEPCANETFDGFDGSSSPAFWSSSNASWQGLYSSGTSSGSYAFDNSGDRSVGIIPGSSTTSFSATYENNTTATITDLNLSLLLRQHLANNPGTSDQLSASYSIDGGASVPIPELEFYALPDATLPLEQTLNVSLTGLNLPIGSAFTLSLTAIQGAPISGSAPDTAFINEFHYDNNSSDVGEFIEVVVSPGYTGDLNTMQVILYNGTNGQSYDTIDLSDFDNFGTPGVSNGYSIYYVSLPTNGIQNGAPDGIALSDENGVLEFISYEGSLTATNGPANGMTSTDIGVSQNGSNPTGGTDSLGRTGSGGEASDFTWTEFQGIAFSQGLANDSQTFTGTAAAPSQAFSFDDVSVCVASPEPDNDNDGAPDSTDPDDDNDGIPDIDEVTLGTDPFLADSDNNGTNDGDEDFDQDGQSNFGEIVLVETDPLAPDSKFLAKIGPSSTTVGMLELSFPTLSGRNYQLFTGSSLDNLTPDTLYVGDGSEVVIQITPTGSSFYSIQVSLP